MALGAGRRIRWSWDEALPMARVEDDGVCAAAEVTRRHAHEVRERALEEVCIDVFRKAGSMHKFSEAP